MSSTERMLTLKEAAQLTGTPYPSLSAWLSNEAERQRRFPGARRVFNERAGRQSWVIPESELGGCKRRKRGRRRIEVAHHLRLIEVNEKREGPMTLKEATRVLGLRRQTVCQYIKAGMLRVIEQGCGRKPTWVDAEEVHRLAAKLREEEMASSSVSEAEESRDGLLTEEVKRASQKLLEALSEACREAGLTKDEADGGIAYLVGGLGDELEARIRMLLKERDGVRNHTPYACHISLEVAKVST